MSVGVGLIGTWLLLGWLLRPPRWDFGFGGECCFGRLEVGWGLISEAEGLAGSLDLRTRIFSGSGELFGRYFLGLGWAAWEVDFCCWVRDFERFRLCARSRHCICRYFNPVMMSILVVYFLV